MQHYNIQDALNKNDIDPITLEPVRQAKSIYFYKNKSNQIFVYDAFSWLEMLVHSEEYRHPIFGTKLNEEDNYQCYLACKEYINSIETKTTNTDIEKRTLIKICESFNVETNIKKDPNGNVYGLSLRCKSPCKWLKIDSVHHIYEEKLSNKFETSPITCTALIEYTIHSADPDCEPRQITLYV